jgi:hypothetical protein
MNPTIDDVALAFDLVNVKGKLIKIDRTGVVLAQGGHFQGIQRVSRVQRSPHERFESPLLVITSSSDSEGYFVPCTMAPDGLTGTAHPRVTMATTPLTHAGGCQAVGHFLVAGLEDFNNRNSSEIQLWDLSGTPTQPLVKINRKGPQDVSTAGAVGLTSLGSGAVLAVATWNAGTVDFYKSVGDPFGGSQLVFQTTWVPNQADKSDWVDQNWGQYQNINLITQSDGQVFMVGFNRGGGDDWMDLFSVDLTGGKRAFRKLAKRHMYCTDGCTFDAGAGIVITSSKAFDVLAVNPKSGDWKTGTTIIANHFQGG